MVLWFVLALLTAIAHAGYSAASKKALEKSSDYAVAWAVNAFAMPAILPGLLLVAPRIVHEAFWPAALASSSLYVISMVLYIRALRLSPLSLTVPMLAFTPVFLIATSFIMLSELPTLIGALGILLVVVGSFILNLKEAKHGILRPFQHFYKERGMFLTLLVAFLFSIGANLDKIATTNSTPAIYAITITGLAALAFTPFVRKEIRMKNLRTNKVLFYGGLIHGVMFLLQMTAILLAIVPYVISVKRSSALFSVILGRAIFKELEFGQRVFGAALMVAGVAIIGVFG